MTVICSFSYCRRFDSLDVTAYDRFVSDIVRATAWTVVWFYRFVLTVVDRKLWIRLHSFCIQINRNCKQ